MLEMPSVILISCYFTLGTLEDLEVQTFEQYYYSSLLFAPLPSISDSISRWG